MVPLRVIKHIPHPLEACCLVRLSLCILAKGWLQVGMIACSLQKLLKGHRTGIGVLLARYGHIQGKGHLHHCHHCPSDTRDRILKMTSQLSRKTEASFTMKISNCPQSPTPIAQGCLQVLCRRSNYGGVCTVPFLASQPQ